MMSPRTTNKLLSLLIVMFCCTLIFTACSKGDTTGTSASQTTGPQPIANIKLTGVVVPGTSKKLTISVSSLGDVNVSKDCTVSTIAAGLDMDANGILPASLVSTSGFTFTGDSVIYNNITITNKAGTVMHGDLLNGVKLYGNLAYATISFGDAFSAKLVTKRVPFFFYYKAVDASNTVLASHGADLFGIGPGYSTGNKLIASPLSYLPVTGTQISGFKLSLVNFNNATGQGACTLQVGLLPENLDATAEFDLHPLTPLVGGGYSSYITGTILYNTSSITGQIAFSTGYLVNSILQDTKYTGTTSTALAANSSVRIITNNGFNYPYAVTSTAFLTSVENPTYSGETRSIFGIDFFTTNEYLVDYTDHQIGLKSN